MSRRRIPSAALVLAAAVLAAGPPLAGFRLVRLGDGDMSPSLQPGEWALLGPGEVELGDVWLLEDPAEPGRRVLRRVLGLEGDEASWKNSRYALNGEATRIREMGRDDAGVVLAEANLWLIRIRGEDTPLSIGPVTVPPGRAWVMADERDRALDSRWWGTVPVASLEREVWLRLGGEDAWRGAVGPNAADGPWYVPPPTDPTPAEAAQGQ